MECPACGYQADDAAVFCPNCRYQFREDTGEEPEPVPDTSAQEEVFENFVAEIPRKFSGKELRMMGVMLQQSAIIVVFIIAIFTYLIIGQVPFVSVSLGSLTLGMAGLISLAAGLAAGIIFFLSSRRSLARFRYR